MSLKRFTSVKTLRGLGRPSLKEFFARFNEELKACKATLPPTSLELHRKQLVSPDPIGMDGLAGWIRSLCGVKGPPK